MYVGCKYMYVGCKFMYVWRWGVGCKDMSKG